MSAKLIDDRGNATIVAVGIITALAALTFVVVAVVTTRLDHHRAQVAADLAAVAGAVAHYYAEDPCARAAETATLNQSVVVACSPDGEDVVVTARVRAVEVTSRAGPL